MSQNNLNPCSIPEQQYPNDDVPPANCPESCQDPSLRNVNGSDFGLNDDGCKVMDGAEALCDPLQSGQIINDIDNPNPDVIYRYSKGLRGCDEAMLDLFRNIVVIDDDGKAHPVPIIWATQERAVAALLQDNVRQDSTVVDRIKLPTMAIYANGYNFNQSRYIYHRALEYLREVEPTGVPGYVRQGHKAPTNIYGVTRGIPIDVSYTLYVWTMFVEDMNQILEQVVTKFSPLAYIRVRGVSWEIGVKLDSIANNIDVEPGDKNQRVVKFEFGMTAETYIPQPIERKKTVLRTKTEILDGLTEEDAIGVISRIEESVKEL
jgi:hypothetical protein